MEFERDDLSAAAATLGIATPDNLGDVIYAFRYRRDLPPSITSRAPEGSTWIIVSRGRSKYAFSLTSSVPLEPRQDLLAIKIPDSTPEIVARFALGDEQALLARVRYNRLIDLFLGITAYSLQNHLRTTVTAMGQIEIDELYVGLDRSGRQFVVPVQAKGGSDRHGPVQTMQDIACCKEKFPGLICRAVSAQFLPGDRIAMFELTVAEGGVKIVEERHYRLVESSEITTEDLDSYRSRQ